MNGKMWHHTRTNFTDNIIIYPSTLCRHMRNAVLLRAALTNSDRYRCECSEVAIHCVKDTREEDSAVRLSRSSLSKTYSGIDVEKRPQCMILYSGFPRLNYIHISYNDVEPSQQRNLKDETDTRHNDSWRDTLALCPGRHVHVRLSRPVARRPDGQHTRPGH